MKRTFLIFAILISIVFVFSACKVTEQQAASKVAKAFLDNLNANKYAKAKKLCTKESAESIDMLESMSRMTNEQKPVPVIANISCRVDGDKGTYEYTENGEEKKLDLVKIKGKWWVRMKKETPEVNSNANQQMIADSIAAAEHSINQNQDHGNNNFNHGNDTVTYFDIDMISMVDLNGSAHIKFNITNRSDWNIKHFWNETYISDKAGKFIQKDELMFDGILDNKMLNNISNVDAVLEKNKIELILKNTKTDDIGEIFLLPVRIQLDHGPDENIPFDININNVAKYVILKNDSSYKVNITF